MNRANNKSDYERIIPVIRGTLSYLCLVALFGCITLIVQVALEEKKIRYQMTDLNFVKLELMKEIRDLDNRISELERYQRIAGLIEEELPQLGPPRHRVIELEVPGLKSENAFSDPTVYRREEKDFLGRMRDAWKSMQEGVKRIYDNLIQ